MREITIAMSGGDTDSSRGHISVPGINDWRIRDDATIEDVYLYSMSVNAW